MGWIGTNLCSLPPPNRYSEDPRTLSKGGLDRLCYPT